MNAIQPVNYAVYSIGIAGDYPKAISLDSMYLAARKAGLDQVAASLETLVRKGAGYSYGEFDIMSAALSQLRKAGVDLRPTAHNHTYDRCEWCQANHYGIPA